jgi:hypothetical protein
MHQHIQGPRQATLHGTATYAGPITLQTIISMAQVRGIDKLHTQYEKQMASRKRRACPFWRGLRGQPPLSDVTHLSSSFPLQSIARSSYCPPCPCFDSCHSLPCINEDFSISAGLARRCGHTMSRPHSRPRTTTRYTQCCCEGGSGHTQREGYFTQAAGFYHSQIDRLSSCPQR